MKYKMEDINIGDKVFFESTEMQSNYDLYWTVISKLDNQLQLIVQLDEMGYKDERWTIGLREVRQHIRVAKHN